MKWVKNTDRSPEKEGNYFVWAARGGGEYIWGGIGTKMVLLFRDDAWFIDPKSCSYCTLPIPDDFGEFKWLDEEE
jgi:hypothetical protein